MCQGREESKTQTDVDRQHQSRLGSARNIVQNGQDRDVRMRPKHLPTGFPFAR